jgi:hypothetical protein
METKKRTPITAQKAAGGGMVVKIKVPSLDAAKKLVKRIGGRVGNPVAGK